MGLCPDPTILGYAKMKGIATFKIETPNNLEFTGRKSNRYNY